MWQASYARACRGPQPLLIQDSASHIRAPPMPLASRALLRGLSKEELTGFAGKSRLGRKEPSLQHTSCPSVHSLHCPFRGLCWLPGTISLGSFHCLQD